jgi:hypothetical protein
MNLSPKENNENLANIISLKAIEYTKKKKRRRKKRL